MAQYILATETYVDAAVAAAVAGDVPPASRWFGPEVYESDAHANFTLVTPSGGTPPYLVTAATASQADFISGFAEERWAGGQITGLRIFHAAHEALGGGPHDMDIAFSVYRWADGVVIDTAPTAVELGATALAISGVEAELQIDEVNFSGDDVLPVVAGDMLSFSFSKMLTGDWDDEQWRLYGIEVMWEETP